MLTAVLFLICFLMAGKIGDLEGRIIQLEAERPRPEPGT